MRPWPHQEDAVRNILAAIQQGQRRICVTSPTGGGKTWIMLELARQFLRRGERVSLYTNRKMLLDQTSRVLADADVEHGVRAAGYLDERERDFQVSSIQTEHSRVSKKKTWALHEASLVLVDEAHLQKGDSVRQILLRHQEAGASYVGFTATPIGLGDLYDHLIVAGTTSQLRKCGALVFAKHYGPDEPDMSLFKKLREGEDLSENDNKKAMKVKTIWGRVWDWFEKLNPEHKPTILFAPGVAESIWFAEQFAARGVTAAHIDGSDVWLDGKLQKSTGSLRDDILAGSRDGSIKVLCNRFVLREGIDAPWLAHGILATIFGSLQSGLQAPGRLLRAYPGLDHVTLQDHGGNWWRHGSLNEDREWCLDWNENMAYGLRADRLRKAPEKQPYRCPDCAKIFVGPKCICGYEVKRWKPGRIVVQTDGSLKELDWQVFKPRRICKKPDGPALWKTMYHRSRTVKGQRTFRQAMALFAQENNWMWPDPSWPLMPTSTEDHYRLISDVPRERLT